MPLNRKPSGPRRWIAIVGLLLAAGCSAGDPPNPDNAVLTAPTPAPGDTEGEAEAELSDADDATLDGLEEQFEDQGVKDIRGAPGEPVTIRLEDELTVDDAAAVCDAVRAAGFADIQLDIDGNVAACP